MPRLPDIPIDLYNEDQAALFDQATKGYPDSVTFMDVADEHVGAIPTEWSDSEEEKKRREQELLNQQRLLQDQRDREQMGQAVASSLLEGSTPVQQDGLPSYDAMLQDAGLGDTWLAQQRDPMQPQPGFQPADQTTDGFTPSDTFQPDQAAQPVATEPTHQDFLSQANDLIGGLFGGTRGAATPEDRGRIEQTLQPVADTIEQKLRDTGAGGIVDYGRSLVDAAQTDDWQKGVFGTTRSAIQQAQGFLDESVTPALNDPLKAGTPSQINEGAKLVLRAADSTFRMLEDAHQAGIEQGSQSPWETLSQGQIPAGIQTGLALLNLTQPEWTVAFQAGHDALLKAGLDEDTANLAMFGAGLTPILRHGASMLINRRTEFNLRNLRYAAEEATPAAAKINAEWRAIEAGLMREGRPAVAGLVRPFTSERPGQYTSEQPVGDRLGQYASEQPSVPGPEPTTRVGGTLEDQLQEQLSLSPPGRVMRVINALTGRVEPTDTRPMAEDLSPRGEGTITIDGVHDSNRDGIAPARQKNAAGENYSPVDVWGYDPAEVFAGTAHDPMGDWKAAPYLLSNQDGQVVALSNDEKIIEALGPMLVGEDYAGIKTKSIVEEALIVDNAADEAFLRPVLTALRRPREDWTAVVNTAPGPDEQTILAVFPTTGDALRGAKALQEAGVTLTKSTIDTDSVAGMYADHAQLVEMARTAGRPEPSVESNDWLARATTELDQMFGPKNPVKSTVETPPVEQPSTAAARKSMGTSGEGTAEVEAGPTYYRDLVNSQYPGDVGRTAAKEIIQNSVDATRENPGGTTRISVDSHARVIEAWDEGSGMTPSVVANEFTKLGSSKKPPGASGGLGTAKIAILGNAESVSVVTIAHDEESGQKIMSIVAGSGDDYLTPGKGLKYWYRPLGEEMPKVASDSLAAGMLDHWPTDADGSLKTGTRMMVKVRNDAAWEESGGYYKSPLEAWSQDFMDTHRLRDQNIEIEIDGKMITRKPSTVSEAPARVISLPTADIEFYLSNELEELRGISVQLQNNGLHQGSYYVPTGAARIPTRIIANVVAKVKPGKAGYPWRADRSTVLDDFQKAIEDYVAKDVAGDSIKKEQAVLNEALKGGQDIGTGGTKFYETTNELSPELTQRLVGSKYLGQLSDTLRDMHDRALAVVQQKLNYSYTFRKSRFLGVGTSSGWLGINLDVLKADPAALETYGILMNPWSLMSETRRRWLANNPLGDDGITELFGKREFWNEFVGQLRSTMLHEIVHNSVRPHDEDFAGVLTRVMGSTHEIDIEAPVRALITQMGKRGILAELGDDSVAWLSEASGTNIFQKIGVTQQVPGGQGGRGAGQGAPGGGNVPGGAGVPQGVPGGNLGGGAAGGGAVPPGPPGAGGGGPGIGGPGGAGAGGAGNPLAAVDADFAKILAERAAVRAGTLPTQPPHVVADRVLGGLGAWAKSITDRRSDIRQIENYVQEVTGRPLPWQFQVWARARVYEGRNDAALSRMQRQLQPALRNLSDTELQVLDGVYEQLDNAYKAMAVANPGRMFSGGARFQDPQQIIAAAQQRMGARWPAIQDALAAIQENTDELRDRLFQTHMIDKGTYDFWMKEFPIYSPIRILDYLNPEAAGRNMSTGGRLFGTATQPYKHLTEQGTEAARMSPLQALVEWNFKTEEFAQRNDIARRLAEWRTDQLLQPFVQPIPKSGDVPKGFQKMNYLKDGQPREVALIDPLFDAMKLADEPGNAIINAGLAAASAPLRLGATALRPSFLAFNAVNDMTWVLYRMGAEARNPLVFAQAIADFARGYHQEVVRPLFGRGETPFQQSLREAGASIGMQSRWSRDRPDMILRQLEREHVWVREIRPGQGVQKMTQDRLGQLMDVAGLIYSRPLTAAAGAVERAPRTGYALHQLRKNPNATPEELALAWRRSTADFDAGSKTFKAINKAIPFFNATAQATNEAFSVVGENPAQSAALMTTIVAGLVANEIYNRTVAPDEYDNVTAFTRNSGIVWMDANPPPEGKKRGLFYFPMRGLPGLLIPLVRNLVSSIKYGVTPEAWDRIAAYMVGSMSPIGPDASSAITSLIPPLVATGTGVLANKDFYRMQDIVSESKRGELTAHQYDDRTSLTARRLAESNLPVIGGHPPLLTDYALRQSSPGPAETALAAMDWMLRMRGDADRDNLYADNQPSIRDTPVVGSILGRFFRTVGSEKQNRAYAQVEKIVAANQQIALKILRESDDWQDETPERRQQLSRQMQTTLVNVAKEIAGIEPSYKDLGLPEKYHGVDAGSPEEAEIDKAHSAVSSGHYTPDDRMLAGRYPVRPSYTHEKALQDKQTDALRQSLIEEVTP